MIESAQSRSENLKTKALGLGFDACAITHANIIDPDDKLGNWLARGFHADMHWMAEQKAARQDIRLKLPGAKSVVILALNYYQESEIQPQGTGKIARYAWGRDYHKVMRPPLQALAQYIQSMDKDVGCYFGVDSAPILERAWAAQAGLGWIGKNSLVLRRDLGSWFFLGVLATTLDLSPDVPVPANCGTCSACMDSCPTQAIVEEGIVDSNLCISYHTIENKNEIPESIAQNFGDWVFGCDVCQEVCPWNRFAKFSLNPDFTARPNSLFPQLKDLIEMNELSFSQSYNGSPIRRAKLFGMQRNAQIALHNQSTKD